MSETAKNYGSIYDLPLQNASALAPEIEKRTVYGPEGGVWKDYVMRHFILPPHRGIPAHVHDWDHLMFTLSGDGVVEVEEEPGKRTPYLMKTGYWTRVPGGLVHEYKNDADIPLEFFCNSPHLRRPARKKIRNARRTRRAQRGGEGRGITRR